jgi:hypothetical protein
MNDDYYECLTPKTTIELLKACQAGKPPPMGRWGSLPMNGQVICTSTTNIIPVMNRCNVNFIFCTTVEL